MQEYLKRTRLSGWMDGIGFHFCAFLFSMLWFFLLWGLRLSACSAGAALYFLLVLLRRKVRDDYLSRKEKSLRQTIGGELALERLILSPADQAHFETAMLLSLRYPLILLKITPRGVLCSWKGENVLVSFFQYPIHDALTAPFVLSMQKEIREQGAKRGLLCVPCKIHSSAIEQGRMEPKVSFMAQRELISLFGNANPATDSQLVQLGKRKRSASALRISNAIFSPSRAKRYAVYGVLLLLMYEFTHLFFYALPGLLCVSFAAACRCVKKEASPLSGDE